MILVRHHDRGYGHAKQLSNGNWEVRFFDNYNLPCVFFHTTTVLTFHP
jgi:hypothetical protein